MKVKELLEKLKEIVEEEPNALNYPIQVQEIIDGITYTTDFQDIELAEEYDGERVWVYLDEELTPPVWMQ